uniref:transposase n=1 Tax=Alicyclobacillus sendaiensis TaxID=192387 RepID=UPI003571324C
MSEQVSKSYWTECPRVIGLGVQKRRNAQLIAQFMVDAEATEKIGAERYERTESRVTQRNGSRSRTWDTRLGTVELKIPKLRQGSFFPSLLEPRRRAEQAL